MSKETITVIDQEGSMVQLLASAERELSAFVTAFNELSGAEQAREAAKDWIEGLERTDWPRRLLRLFYLQIERDREGNHISIWPISAFRGG